MAIVGTLETDRPQSWKEGPKVSMSHVSTPVASGTSYIVNPSLMVEAICG